MGKKGSVLIFHNILLNDEVNLDGGKTTAGLFGRGTKG